jgi:hypothetical protein
MSIFSADPIVALCAEDLLHSPHLEVYPQWQDPSQQDADQRAGLSRGSVLSSQSAGRGAAGRAIAWLLYLHPSQQDAEQWAGLWPGFCTFILAIVTGLRALLACVVNQGTFWLRQAPP